MSSAWGRGRPAQSGTSSFKNGDLRMAFAAFRHPPGLFLVAATEFWERYSYYGMVGLLTLFLTTSPAAGGFGWSTGEALRLYGFYTGCAFAAPAVGGWLANTWLGERTAILIGGLTLAAGHLLLFLQGLLPSIVRWATGADIQGAFERAAVKLGVPFSDAATQQALRAVAGTAADAVLAVYALSAWMFMLSLGLIIAGTALLKPTISSIVGKLYADDDSRRDAGFALFMTAIYLGSITASLTAGTLGEHVGWHWGFGAAGIGMCFGIAVYALLNRRLLGSVGMERGLRVSRSDRHKGVALSPVERDRLFVIFVLGVFTVLYAVAFYQKGGLLNLFVRDHVDRGAGALEIPIVWFQTISTIVFVLLATPATGWFQRLALAGRDPDPVFKLAIALAFLACGYLMFLGAALDAAGGAQASWLWVLAGYAFFGIGDVLLWPIQLSLASRLAPERYAPMVIGCWYLTIGIGSWLTGYVGGLSEDIGAAGVFRVLVFACLGGGLFLMLVRKGLVRRMHLAHAMS